MCEKIASSQLNKRWFARMIAGVKANSWTLWTYKTGRPFAFPPGNIDREFLRWMFPSNDQCNRYSCPSKVNSLRLGRISLLIFNVSSSAAGSWDTFSWPFWGLGRANGPSKTCFFLGAVAMVAMEAGKIGGFGERWRLASFLWIMDEVKQKGEGKTHTTVTHSGRYIWLYIYIHIDN